MLERLQHEKALSAALLAAYPVSKTLQSLRKKSQAQSSRAQRRLQVDRVTHGKQTAKNEEQMNILST